MFGKNCQGCKDGVCKGGCKSHGCLPSKIAKILVIIGGINWGLVGFGMLLGKDQAWNIVHNIFATMPTLEGIIYALVGVAAVMKIFHCKCHKCAGGTCAVEGENTEAKM